MLLIILSMGGGGGGGGGRGEGGGGIGVPPSFDWLNCYTPQIFKVRNKNHMRKRSCC